jgi:hypothetical protein
MQPFTEDLRAVAQQAYEAYENAAGWKNYQNLPMPQWEELPPNIQQYWCAVANYFYSANNTVVVELAKTINLEIVTQDGMWFWKHEKLRAAQQASKTALEALINYIQRITSIYYEYGLPLPLRMGATTEEQLELNKPVDAHDLVYNQGEDY